MFDITSKKDRLNNLYRIIDKNSNSIPFKLNSVQDDVLDNLHTRNIILKARQLGMSTFAILYIVDEILFSQNLCAGIVSYSLEHAQHIFKKIVGHALETLPKAIKANVKVIQSSARELTLDNGSSLRVDTTLRGGSYPLVLVSEFGKTCARNPQKAEEVITGTLQAVPKNGKVIIESTGEGNEGYFAEMVNVSSIRGNDNLSDLEYKLFFYPWYLDKGYSIDDKINYGIELSDYFKQIEKEANITLSEGQKNWYALQTKILGVKIKQEFPSTIQESFLSSSDAFYFAEAIAEAYKDNRCLHSSLCDALLPVYVACDIGLNDLTVFVFFQLAHGEIRVIDYYEDKNKDVPFYANFLLQDKKYTYHTIFLPHDSKKRSYLDIQNTYERDFKRLFAGTSTKFHVLPRKDKQLQISHARIMLNRCVFNLNKTKSYIDRLSKYRKKWNESTSRYSEEPLHSIDCFIGETLVDTCKGKIRIDDIKVGDNVKTPSGFRKVLNLFKFKTNKLVTVSQGNLKVTCTPHHKFFTNKSVVTADSLCYDTHILTLKDEKIWKTISYLGNQINLGFKDYFLLMNQKQLSISTGTNTKKTSSDIGLAEMLIQAVVDRCIGLCGYILMEKPQKNMTYTTLMGINQIIQLKISKLFYIPNICECTCQQMKEKSYQESIFLKQLKHQNNGMEVKKVWSGINNMEKIVPKKNNLLQKTVLIEKKNIFLFKSLQNIVAVHVVQCIEGILEKMMKRENVKYVLKNLHVIDFPKEFAVPVLADQYNHIEVDVYDIEVETDHCYFANGFLVSNSNHADSFMYMCQGVSHLEAVGNMHNSALERHRSVVRDRTRILS